MAFRRMPVDEEREAAIVDAFVHLSDTLADEYDVSDFLRVLAERCVALGAIDEAAVMVVAPDGRFQAVASSSERSRSLEVFELRHEEGPCLDAFRTGAVVASADLSREGSRWPTFSAHAVDAGVHAVHSVPLQLRDQVIGSIGLMCDEPGAVNERDARLLRALADVATVGVLQERAIALGVRDASGLQTALTSRIRIEQAKGVLAERLGVSIDDAFGLLRGHARTHGVLLTDVAVAVVERTLEITGGVSEGLSGLQPG